MEKKSYKHNKNKHLRYLFFLMFFDITSFSIAQNVQWSLNYKINPPYTCPDKGTGVDRDGNIYLIGATVPSSPTIYSQVHYITKFSPSGQVLWSDSITGGVDLDVLRTDSAGNSYIIGRFDQIANIGGVVLTDTVNHMVCFYAKYNSIGVCQWAFRLNERTSIGDIYPLSSGGFYMEGYSSTDPLYLLNDTIPANHGFIAKLDSNGALTWGKPIGEQLAYKYLKIDVTGNFYISGGVYGTSYVGEGSNRIYISSNSNTSAFIAKFDSALNVQWAKVGQTYGANEPVSGLDLDSTGNVYVAGTMGYYMDFDGHTISTNGDNMYLVKYDPAGNYQWMRYSYTLSSGISLNDCYGLSVDKAGNSYVTGGLRDTTYFDAYTGFGGPYLIKYDSDGNLIWGLNSEILPPSAFLDGAGMAVCNDNLGNVFVAGNYSSGGTSFLTKISKNMNTTSVIAFSSLCSLNVYPNPSTGAFQISYFSTENTISNLTIINSTGQAVYSQQVGEFQGTYIKEIDLSNFSKGIYAIEISNEKMRKVKKIVVN